MLFCPAFPNIRIVWWFKQNCLMIQTFCCQTFEPSHINLWLFRHLKNRFKKDTNTKNNPMFCEKIKYHHNLLHCFYLLEALKDLCIRCKTIKKVWLFFYLNRFLDWTMNLFVWISSNSVQYYEWSLDHSYNHFRQKIQTFMHLDIIRTFSERLDTKK